MGREHGGQVRGAAVCALAPSAWGWPHLSAGVSVEWMLVGVARTSSWPEVMGSCGYMPWTLEVLAGPCFPGPPLLPHSSPEEC